MSIKHDDHFDVHPDEAFEFANLEGLSVSICAPASWTKEQVEEMAGMDDEYAETMGPLRCVDKSTLGLGSPTPNPCNHDPLHRKHWFLIR